MAYQHSNLAVQNEEELTSIKHPKIKTTPGSRAKRKSFLLRRNLAIVAYVLILGCSLIYGKIQLMEENHNLTDAQDQLDELQGDYERLETQVNNLVSLSNIEKLAKEAGMTEMQNSQVENIIVETQDVAEVSEQESNLLDKLAELWDKILNKFSE